MRNVCKRMFEWSDTASKTGGIKCQVETEQDLLVKRQEQVKVSEEVVGDAWVETFQGQGLEVTVFARVVDRELLISGVHLVIQQIARNVGQKW